MNHFFYFESWRNNLQDTGVFFSYFQILQNLSLFFHVYFEYSIDDRYSKFVTYWITNVSNSLFLNWMNISTAKTSAFSNWNNRQIFLYVATTFTANKMYSVSPNVGEEYCHNPVLH